MCHENVDIFSGYPFYENNIFNVFQWNLLQKVLRLFTILQDARYHTCIHALTSEILIVQIFHLCQIMFSLVAYSHVILSHLNTKQNENMYLAKTKIICKYYT